MKSIPKREILVLLGAHQVSKTSSLANFISKYKPKQAVIITKNFLHQSRLGKTKVFHIPAWMV